MKLLNTIFGLTLAGVSASPTLSAIYNADNTVLLNKTNNEEKKLKCTVTYIGKKCSAYGLPIIARCVDSNPKACVSVLKRYEHNERANTTLKGTEGFEYKLPSETYSYICAPDYIKTDPKGSEYQFENFAMNEMGVGLSCTLTTYSNLTALAADPKVDTGLGEEMLNQVIIPQAKSAKHAMQIAADALTTHGACETNTILAIDQKEAWLMEIYTGHQYCAVKLPEDKVCIAGNEFILDSLSKLGISEANKEDCIVSPGLLSVPIKGGFDKYVDGGTDIYHLDLFNTYALEGSNGAKKFDDNAHMRTWRGYSLFDQSSSYPKYSDTTKYDAFLIPKDANGNTRNDITFNEVLNVYRDEFDDIVDPNSSRFDQHFKDLKDAGTLRSIATETTRSVHALTCDPTLPREIAVNAWFCPSSSNYSPFIPLNNGIQKFDDCYSYQPQRYEFDSNCASTVHKQLNSLASRDRINYGYPLQYFSNIFETIYTKQMRQVLSDANSKKSLSDAKNIITNFNRYIRDLSIDNIRNATIDLNWHIMNDDQRAEPKRHTTFSPLVDIEKYLTDFGWTDFKHNDKEYTFKYGNVQGKLSVGDGYYKEQGIITIDNLTQSINVAYRNNRAYVDLYQLNQLIDGKTKIRTINIDDYLDKFNHWLWAGPLLAVGVIGIGIGTYFIIKKKKAKSVL